MTEEVWLFSSSPADMLEFIAPSSSDRKLHYYAIACCRRIARLLPHPASLNGVDVLERYIEGQETLEELGAVTWHVEGAAFRFNYLREADVEAQSWIREVESMPPDQLEKLIGTTHVLDRDARGILTSAAYFVDRCVSSTPLQHRENHQPQFAEKSFQSRELMLDIFGNPFRPVAFEPVWRTSTVHALASQMYDTRDFAPMPVLADALEDAGCEHADVLAHCRGAGPHVRGCWVVDLVLGKS